MHSLHKKAPMKAMSWGKSIAAAVIAAFFLTIGADGHADTDILTPKTFETVGPQICPTGEGCPDRGECGRSYWKPVGRIAVTQLVLQMGTWLIWPETYGPKHFPDTPKVFSDNFWHAPRLQAEKTFFKWDGDSYFINVVGHGLFGSEMYMAARDWGHGIGVSFLYALVGSTFWEYFVEGLFQRPSSVDLIWTPTAGLIFGELRHRILQWVRTDIYDPLWRQTLLFLFDPIGELERLVLYGCERRFAY